MNIKKFRIKNYKSIIDSGDCYLTDSVSILAGKNESGKTSILEALEDFDTETEIRTEAKPIKHKDAIPEISITFEISKDVLKEIFEEIGLDKEFSEDVLLEITKIFPKEFVISKKTKNELGVIDAIKESKIQKSVENFLQTIKTIHGKYPQIGGNVPEVDFENLPNFKTLIIQFRNQTNPNLVNIADEKEKEQFSLSITEILKNIVEFGNLLNAEEKFIEEIKNYIPNFILYSSFNDEFPHEILKSELGSNEWASDLSKVSDFNATLISRGSEQEKIEHKTNMNIELKGKFKKYWTQNPISLVVDWDSEKVRFWIEEDGVHYRPDQRSKGQQWHLSFYIKIGARAREDVPNVILIDEPGLYLHAQAQKDILLNLEDQANNSQVIFSTHSPYLLEAEILNRIKLIHRTKKGGTKIENKIHALADKETLTPILTAIGLELNSGIANLDKLKNVIVEGASDLYYLEAFKKLRNKNDVHFVFGGGAGNMPFVGTILHGWGCKVLYLYDNDKGKKDGEKNLKKNWLVTKDLVLSVIDKEGTIEDVFNQDDFKKYILKDESKTYSQSNSEYLKENKIDKIDKVVSAKLFLELVGSKKGIKLNQVTSDNIVKLFENIEKKF